MASKSRRRSSLGVDADVGVGLERDPLVLHQLDPAVDDVLLELEVGDAVHQQPADPVRPLVDRDPVPRLVELRRRRQSRGAGPDDGDLLARANLRRLGLHVAVGEGGVDDRLLDQLDGDRLLVDVEDARLLTGRRADAAGELREVVRLEQHVQGVLPPVLVNQVVPLGDDVAQRAAVVAEGDATVHAARALRAELVIREGVVDLVPVEDAQLDRPPLRQLAGNLFKSGGLAHDPLSTKST